MTFFRDGLELYTFDVPGGPSASSEGISVGSLQDGTQRLNGEVDDLRFLDRPMGAADIGRIMAEQPHPNPAAAQASRVPAAPLYEDPLFNSAKDVAMIWNRAERAWWFLYTQIRNGCRELGASLDHGSTLGAASSLDGGLTWTYRGTLRGLEFEPGRNTFWAPDVFRWRGSYWLLADDNGTRDGLRVYRSSDCRRWERRPNILKESGARPLDVGPAHHPEVIVNGDEAFIFCWIDSEPPPREDSAQNCYEQVARLELADGELMCDRNAVFELRLPDGPG